jgi:hypothetical protein
MPGTLEALAIFAFAIAPGYALITGYQHQRSHSAPERDLHVLAQAFVFSAVWLGLTWWPIGHLLVRWTADHELDEHQVWAWLLISLFLGGSYVAGRLAGAFVRRVAAKGNGFVFEAMKSAGVFDRPSLWDWIWADASSRVDVLLVITYKDGEVLEGQYAGKSWADLSPRRPRVYLQTAYGYDGDGNRVIYPHGAYVEGDQIVDIKFKT